MPIACIVAHDPDPRGALFLDSAAFASCRRCGAGLVDRGAGWRSALPWIAVLLRREVAADRLVPARAAMRRSRDY